MSALDLLRSELQGKRRKRLTVKARGSSLILEPRFQDAMRLLCRERNLNPASSFSLQAAVLEYQGIMLLWPCHPDTPCSFPVTISPSRRATTEIAPAFEALHVRLPAGVTIRIPVSHFFSTRFGRCLALHFNAAEFLYRNSRPAGLGCQNESENDGDLHV